MVSIAAASKRRTLTAPAAGMAPPMVRGSTQCTLADALAFSQAKNEASLGAYLTGDAGLAGPEIVAGCIGSSYYETRGFNKKTMDGIRRRLTPAQQMERIFTLREHQASSAWRIEDNFCACSCNSLLAMLANEARVESMCECRYGPPCTGRNHIIALDKDKVVETVDSWISFCQQNNLPTWATNGTYVTTCTGRQIAYYHQGDIAWAAAKIDVPADSPLAAADVVVPQSFGGPGGDAFGVSRTHGACIQEAPVSDSEWI